MTIAASELLSAVDLLRIEADRHLEAERRVKFGQFMTPEPVARLMASLIGKRKHLRILEGGAGVGSLFAAAVDEATRWGVRSVSVTAFEIDDLLAGYIPQTFRLCQERLPGFSGMLMRDDFIQWGCERLAGGLFAQDGDLFNVAILNPPYRKIASDGPERQALRKIGIETSNLYTAFMAIAVKLLEPGGEMVSITPRSFCNGPYFKPFREFLLREAAITHIHIFESRKSAFKDNAVLQENIILRVIKGKSESVQVSSSRNLDGGDMTLRQVDSVVEAGDPDRVIHVTPNDLEDRVAARIREFDAALPDIGLQVSTGRVVDFRAKDSLHSGVHAPRGTSYPLIYPTHFDNGRISWPKEGKKANFLKKDAQSDSLLVPAGFYVLVKRFSAKEERRRIVAAVCSPLSLDADFYAFENHLNYYHVNGQGMDQEIADGLCVYLNSTLVDSYFRQFSGHTQVNASDLRSLPYPREEVLRRLGQIGAQTQEAIDEALSKELPVSEIDPLKAKSKIDNALAVLSVLGLPRAQQNERSALTLLALLDLKPGDAWSDASSPLIGITPIMDFAKQHYGTNYAPNTRETFRRQTMHQFVEAGIARYNPDNPKRPVNSPKAVYQITPLLLDALRTLGTAAWGTSLKEWLAQVQTLKARYAKEREMAKIPLKLPTGQRIELSPGGQNVLVEQIIHEFCPRFCPGGVPVYVGDTEEKYAFFDKAHLTELGVAVDSHGKMPDVVIHYVEKNWLLLIEAVTSHGPVDGKRHDELRSLFGASAAPLVYVTAFMDRAAMVRFLGDIAWETEVWVADAPSHMIHFNGERFLGPYDSGF